MHVSIRCGESALAKNLLRLNWVGSRGAFKLSRQCQKRNRTLKAYSLILLGAIATMTACTVDPQAAADRRATLINQVFPSEADRKGVHLAFPIETGMNIVFFPDEVSQRQIDQRMNDYCARIGHPQTKVSRPPEPSSATLEDGSKRAATSVWYDCD